MKFLCMTCDDSMKLQETRGPDQGSMTVVFQCTGCGWQMAMLTNPMETQTVRSLGVKIGGATQAPQPMEMLRANLSGVREELQVPEGSAATAAPEIEEGVSRCPFSAMLGGDTSPEAVQAASEGPHGASATVQATPGGLAWTQSAMQRIEERIPSFIRPMARVAIEKYAEEKGYAEVTEDVLDETRGMFTA